MILAPSQRLLPCRLVWCYRSLVSKSAYLKDLNCYTIQYYTNPLIQLCNNAAQEIAWEYPNAQTLPYSRGFAYLRKVNAQIQKASDGKRSADGVVLDLLQG